MFAAKKRFGQNFLTDRKKASRLVAALELTDDDTVIEIGPGTGALTELILQSGARLLAVEPNVLLMDEPASALDPIATSKIEDLLYELKREYTIIIVTHNMQQAARVATHTAFFLLGELIEYASTIDLFERPRDKRTEDYVTGKFG